MQKRFSHGISFLSSFSYGKSIDNGSGIRTTVGDPLTPSNDYDLELETGPSAFDFRKRWTTSWIWELPVGRDRRFMNRGGVADFVLGGWQLGGILTLQDGFPFTLTCGPGTVQNGGGGCYPDPAPAEPGLAAAGERAQPDALFQYERIHRSRSGARNEFPLRHGETELARRARHQEPRHVDQQAIPGRRTITSSSASKCSICRTCRSGVSRARSFGTPNYGVITSTRMDSRQIQLGMKYVF